MKTIKDIEKAIAGLPPDQLNQFRIWFSKFDAEIWDKKFEADVKAGKLDKLADQAMDDFLAGNCSEL